MGLELPDLDDREFEALVEDARKRIPVHSDEWTDHNVHDPGITILELLAWVAETDSYRLDRITDAHVEQYLRLVGIRRTPPQPATVRLELDPPPTVSGERIEAGTPLRAGVTREPREQEPFRTTAGVTLTRADIEAVVSQHRDGRTDNTDANDTEGMFYLPFGDDPTAGDAMYLGFDTDPFADADRLDLAVDFHEADLPAPATHGDEPVEFVPSHRVAWEFYTDPNGTDDRPYEQWYDDDRWAEFTVRRDGTSAFYEGGTVSLLAQADVAADDGPTWTARAGSILGLERESFWLRCRLARREPEPEPLVPACEESPSSPPTPRYEVPPQFDAVHVNVLEAEHCATVSGEALERREGERTTARPDQTFFFPHNPVQSATVTVGGTEWVAVPDFAGSGPDDRHYVLHRVDGAVRFGDGAQGRVPAADQAVVATSYVYGGGPDGNLPATARWRFTDDALSSVDITPLEPATGGTAAESVEEALVRAKSDRSTPYRAVTRDDYRYLATHTPGLRFGRAAVVDSAGAGVDEATSRGDDGDGTVRVVVVPFSPPDTRPVPSEGFLDAVDCHLQRHALLSDDVTAVAPTYVGVDVGAEVRIAPGYDRRDRQVAAESAVEAFLDPLRGFEGDGWPFGRGVYLSELYQVLETTDGVDTVVDVSVTTDQGGDLEDGTALPYPESVTVVVLDRPGQCGRES
ncbi:putative baseplate assembly protein [Salinigranum halophilum]|uniref:putative baseplate assembly protein n=1 Tax=Salinigranum halophilum TaxID=2565931 RepID=UPI0010A83EA0|nr:putative baseplate assembly protein [Salinigranum halophilum]